MKLGERIGRAVRPGTILALRGGLAAGKTTLTKGIAAGLGIVESITSPTYTIISDYEGRLPLFHMDAYRLNGADDFIAIGAEDYLFADGVSVVEWSERVEAALPSNSVRIGIEVRSDGSRRIVIDDPFLEESLR